MAWLVAAALAVSCSSTRPGAPPAGPPVAEPRRTETGVPSVPEWGGWLLAPDEIGVRDAEVAPDGRRRFILRGMRWVDHPDGSIERARQVFEEEEVKALALPDHLGGGYIFYAGAGPATRLWRSHTWTGDLQPLGSVEPPVSQITPGFDRLYLASATSYTLRAIDPATGEPRDLSPLPPAASYGEMVFADAWRAVVLTAVRGALASFDAGETWHPVAAPGAVTGVALQPGGILLTTASGLFQLQASGRLLPTSATGSDASFAGAQTFARFDRAAFPAREAPAPASRPLGRRPLRSAVMRGWPDTPETAVVVEPGAWGRVRLRDGALLSLEPFAGRTPCRGVALGAGFGFVCGEAGGPTEVYAHRHGQLELEFRLEAAHRVRPNGNGALVIDAPCRDLRGQEDAAASRAAAVEVAPGPRGARCVRLVSGELFEVQVRGDVGAERMAALRDGRVVVLIPPRSNSPGRLSILGRGDALERSLSLEPETGPAARLVRSGSWLDELWEVGPGQLGAWVVGAQAFVGVRVGLDGVVQIARLQDGVDETSFYGPHALQLAASASLRQSSNHGFEWHVSEVPPALLAAGTSSAERHPARGCSPVGCVHDDWIRIGHDAEENEAGPARPPAPARVAYPAPGFAFWTLDCVAAARSRRTVAADMAGLNRTPVRGAERRRSLTAPAARAPGTSPEPPESSAWLPLQNAAPPARGAADVGYDFGETSENGAYRAYAWGPGRGDWARHGRWSVRVGDRFSLDPPWSTAVTRTPWSDAAGAAQAFGLDANTGVDWWLRLGAGGGLGVLQIRVRSASSLHLLDRERAILTLRPPAGGDLGMVVGAAEVDDRWYLGASRAEQFQLYRVEQGQLELLASYPLWGRIPTQLITSAQGDELALLQKSSGSGWYVTPIDLETFEPRPALFLPNEVLGRVPPRCDEGRPGWLAVSGVPLTDSAVSESNTHLDFTGGASGLRTKRLTARVVLDESGLCVDALAALVDGVAVSDPRPPEANSARHSLPLVVTDPLSDRRWAFRCAP